VKDFGCWRWFNRILNQAGIEVNEVNEETIEKIIHEFIGEKVKYKRCSTDWRKTRKTINEDEILKGELISRLKTIKA